MRLDFSAGLMTSLFTFQFAECDPKIKPGMLQLITVDGAFIPERDDYLEIELTEVLIYISVDSVTIQIPGEIPLTLEEGNIYNTGYIHRFWKRLDMVIEELQEILYHGTLYEHDIIAFEDEDSVEE